MNKTHAMGQARLHAVVYGLVQGVNFRYYTRLQAESMGLAGWVANRPDGTVEVIAEGVRDVLEELLDWLHHGPSSASVDEVQADWQTAKGEFDHFQIRY